MEWAAGCGLQWPRRPFHNEGQWWPGCSSPGAGAQPQQRVEDPSPLLSLPQAAADTLPCPSPRCQAEASTCVAGWHFRGFYGSWGLCTNGKHMIRLLRPAHQERPGLGKLWHGRAGTAPALCWSLQPRPLPRPWGVWPGRLRDSCLRAFASDRPFLCQDSEGLKRRGQCIPLAHLLRTRPGGRHGERGFSCFPSQFIDLIMEARP